MKVTRILMDMPITIEVVDPDVSEKDIEELFGYFHSVESVFSMFRDTSEISKINAGSIKPEQYSADMKTILQLGEQTKRETNGYFDMKINGKVDPTGVVKGWAIYQVSQKLLQRGFQNHYVDAGGDIQVQGKKTDGTAWRIGIRNPFHRTEIVKTVALNHEGIATSGTAIRGQHIYNPHKPGAAITDIASMTVIGPNVCEADRFATPAFAMGREGITFIEHKKGLEGYMIDSAGIATYTSGFNRYVI